MEEIRLTTWDVKNLVNNGINYLSTGAGFFYEQYGVLFQDASIKTIANRMKSPACPGLKVAKVEFVPGIQIGLAVLRNRKKCLQTKRKVSFVI